MEEARIRSQGAVSLVDFARSLTVPCFGAESRSSTRAPVMLNRDTIGGRVREWPVREPAWEPITNRPDRGPTEVAGGRSDL